MTDKKKVEILKLDFGQKIIMVETLAQELLNQRVEFANLSGEYYRAKTDISILNSSIRALQSALRAERDL
jgi:hypothetical protein